MENLTTARARGERERETMPDLLRTILEKKIAPRADPHDRAGSFPADNCRDLHSAKLLGLTIPERLASRRVVLDTCNFRSLGIPL
jgi:alkylation response protein AidB-like acyl-CoA dehydrogenase